MLLFCKTPNFFEKTVMETLLELRIKMILSCPTNFLKKIPEVFGRDKMNLRLTIGEVCMSGVINLSDKSRKMK